MNKFWQYITGINIIVILITINLLVGFLPYLQIDLTANRLHSISTTSKKIIKSLDDVVNVKVYITSDLPPEIKPVAADLKVVLNELAAINRSKLKITMVDPNKDSNAKAEASKYGIQMLQFSSVKSDKLEVLNGYFGLVMLYGGKQEVLPVVSDVGNLEYFMVSGIKRLTSKGLPTVAIYQDGAKAGTDTQYLRKYLARSYNVVEAGLTNDTQLPAEAKTLVVIGPTTKLGAKDEIAIKNWLGNGKGLILLNDKYSVGDNLRAIKGETTGWEKIVESEGMKLLEGMVMDDSSAVANFKTPSGAFVVKYPYWPVVRPEAINQKLPIVSGVNSLNLAWASPIEVSAPAISLFKSSQKSWVNESPNSLMPMAQVTVSNDQQKSQTLGAISTDGVKLAVIGDSDMIRDQYVASNQQNLVLILNLVDYFSQDSSLMEIRGKILIDTPIMQLSDSQKKMIKTANLITPIIFLGGMFLVTYRIRKNKLKRWYELSKK